MISRWLQRAAADVWLLLQGTFAVTAAWYLARDVFGHDDPFFAPVAAMVSLNTNLGERGTNALRLLFGALLGIGTGEVIVGWLGLGYGRLAFATFVAMALARALGGVRLVMAQAAGGAILTVATSEGDEIGLQRLADALIGVGTALVFSQFLFSPEPLTLVHRAEQAALGDMADGLGLAGRSLATGDEDLGDQAVLRLRELRDKLSELARTRKASIRVTRHAPIRLIRRRVVVRASERAGHLDLLGASCLLLTRTALALGAPERERLAPAVRRASDILATLAEAPGDADVRQAAVDRASALAEEVGPPGAGDEATVEAVRVAMGMLVADLAAFAGGGPPVGEG